MRFFLSAVATFGFGATLLLGCGSEDPTTDPIVLSELFGECTVDAECPGEGAVCRTNLDGYPGGYCTVPCVDRTVCYETLSTGDELHHHCVDADGDGDFYCEKSCQNGFDCGRDDYSCAGEIAPTDTGMCFPICSPGSCGTDAFCNVDSGLCQETEPTGAAIGEACSEGSDCQSGTCYTTEGGATWTDGYCVGPCILPAGYNSNTYFDANFDGATDADLPQGTCADGAVCYLNILDFSDTEGDAGVCMAACNSNDDCRDGYGCGVFSIYTSVSATFELAVCLPSS